MKWTRSRSRHDVFSCFVLVVTLCTEYSFHIPNSVLSELLHGADRIINLKVDAVVWDCSIVLISYQQMHICRHNRAGFNAEADT